MTSDDKYVTIWPMRNTRPISWIKAAQKNFHQFPKEAQDIFLDALTLAAEGAKSSLAKPFKGVGSGVFEIALPFKGEAYRTIYAVKLGEAIWVIHAFQKKSKTGIKTPKKEVEVIKKRLKWLKEELS